MDMLRIAAGSAVAAGLAIVAAFVIVSGSPATMPASTMPGAFTASPAGQLHSLMGAIVHGQTFSIDGRTYAARAIAPRARRHNPALACQH